ncbi:MAG: hypothetical protein IH908_14540 [Proteobacteria bacterium]|nr:hypothetical protein [Pseudomonadota bacterium]
MAMMRYETISGATELAANRLKLGLVAPTDRPGKFSSNTVLSEEILGNKLTGEACGTPNDYIELA